MRSRVLDCYVGELGSSQAKPNMFLVKGWRENTNRSRYDAFTSRNAVPSVGYHVTSKRHGADASYWNVFSRALFNFQMGHLDRKIDCMSQMFRTMLLQQQQQQERLMLQQHELLAKFLERKDELENQNQVEWKKISRKKYFNEKNVSCTFNWTRKKTTTIKLVYRKWYQKNFNLWPKNKEWR